MVSEEVRCGLLSYLIANHGYGGPKGKDEVVNNSGLRSDQLGDAKTAFEELRDYRFIVNGGKRGIMLNNSEFKALADYLYDSCGWAADDIILRLKHYEGWSNHTWSPE